MSDATSHDSAPPRATRSPRPGSAARGTRARGESPQDGGRGLPTPATVAKVAARAQAIRAEAGSKLTAAMRELVYAAAGLTGFAVETARDVVQFLVRGGQMAQDEGERLLREAEAASKRRVAAGRVPELPVATGAEVAAPVVPAVPAKRVRKRAAKGTGAAGDDAVASTPADPAADDPPAAKTGAKRAARRAEGRPPAKKAVGKRAGRGSVAAGDGTGRARGGAKAGATKRAD